MHTVSVALAGREYPVVVGAGAVGAILDLLPDDLKKNLSACTIHLLTDDNVGMLYADRVQKTLKPQVRQIFVHTLPAGERTKSFTLFEALSESILQQGIDRRSVIIALGGGVIGDLAGFLAATLLRGLAFIQIPTSLLAQVDSSVGGKTGINTSVGKNLVGAFHQPRLVICDSDVLATLPPREFAAGYAEILKAGLLADASFVDWLETNADKIAARDPATLHDMIARAVKIKADIVTADEFEENGLRARLNLGHTFGHAYETLAGYDGRLLHGEAVGLGLVLAAKLSQEMGLIGSADVERMTRLVKRANLPVKVSDVQGFAPPSVDDVVNIMRRDKKARGGQMVFVVLEKIGLANLRQDIDEQMVRKVLTGA
jgi:3-dehydroquinate synthase